MPAIPAAALRVVQAPRARGGLGELLHGPAAVGPLDQSTPRGVRRQSPDVPLAGATGARHGALAEQPALRPCADAGMARGAWSATGGPVPPHRHDLCTAADGGVLTPGAGLPARRQQGLKDSRGLLPRRGARRRLATALRARGGHARGRTPFFSQAYPPGAADAHHIGALAGLEALQEGGGAPSLAAATPQATGTPQAWACSSRASANAGFVCTAPAGGTWPVARRAGAVAPASGRESGAVRGPCTGAACVGSSATSGALTTPGPWATVPSAPASWRAPPTARRPCVGRPGSARPRRPWGGLCATQVRRRCWARAWASQVTSVQRGGKRAVDVPATAAAMVSQCLCGKSVSNPVREHSTLSRLVERRQRGAKGAREVASSGSVAGLAFGTMDVGIWEHTAASSGEYEESV